MERRTRFEEPLSPKRDSTFPGKAVEKFDPKSLPANFFYVSISGVIESGEVHSFLNPLILIISFRSLMKSIFNLNTKLSLVAIGK